MKKNWKHCKYHPSPIVRVIQALLLVLIVVGVALLLTQKIWVPKLVDYLVQPVAISTVQYTPHKKPANTVPSTRPGKIDTGVEGIVTIGPVCPVVKNPPAPECENKPYKTTLILITNIIGRNGGVLIETDERGYFSHELVPGSYTIRSQSGDSLPRLTPVTFQVEKGKITSLNLLFDSGIR